MIQKITPRLTSTIKQPIRKNLQKTSIVGLTLLAGSSMSGGNITPSVTKDMIIPGGLDFKEKAYYVLTGELPRSVKERLIEMNENNALSDGDQIVNLTMRGEQVEFINEGPHSIDGSYTIEPLDSNAQQNIINFDINDDTVDLTDIDGNEDSSDFDIWEHLSGMY